LRRAIAIVTNGTSRARNPANWGDGTTACASDSKHFGAWDQNLTTQWHVRYGGQGIMKKLYRPDVGHPDAYPHLQAVLTRPIDWGLICRQYDQMVKYATAVRLGTAETEAILRRFTRTQHAGVASAPELHALHQHADAPESACAAALGAETRRPRPKRTDAADLGARDRQAARPGPRQADASALTPLIWEHVTPYGALSST